MLILSVVETSNFMVKKFHGIMTLKVHKNCLKLRKVQTVLDTYFKCSLNPTQLSLQYRPFSLMVANLLFFSIHVN